MIVLNGIVGPCTRGYGYWEIDEVPILLENLGNILDNYADAIEGGNSYRGSGDAYYGIPSKRSHDVRLSVGEVATSGSTTTAQLQGIPATTAAQLLRNDAAPYFLLCATQSTGELNTGAARKITDHDGTDIFTVAPAFAEAVQVDDTFSVLEGFKRMYDGNDFEHEDTLDKSGHDRAFSLELVPGRRLDWGGDGTEIWDSELRLRLRILKRGRERTARKSVLENIQNILSILTGISGNDLRGDYVQSLTAMDRAPEITVNDQTKVVALAKFRIIYRFDAAYK